VLRFFSTQAMAPATAQRLYEGFPARGPGFGLRTVLVGGPLLKGRVFLRVLAMWARVSESLSLVRERRSTRLVTRTKESNMSASVWAFKPIRATKVRGRKVCRDAGLHCRSVALRDDRAEQT